MTFPENLNLDDLRKKAEAATGGEWHKSPNPSADTIYGRQDNGSRAHVGRIASAEDLAFVLAAQPQVVIGLIDELDAARKRIAEQNAALREIALHDLTGLREPYRVIMQEVVNSACIGLGTTRAELMKEATTLNGGKQP